MNGSCIDRVDGHSGAATRAVVVDGARVVTPNDPDPTSPAAAAGVSSMETDR